MKERLSRERQRQRAADLWAATFVLLGLRYSKAFAEILFQEVLGMEESVTYQAIVDKGRLAGVRDILFRLGRKQFCPADDATGDWIHGPLMPPLWKRCHELNVPMTILAGTARMPRSG